MDDRFLGTTGTKVSELCLGVMTFGRDTDEATAHAMLDLYAEAGGRFLDTADTYQNGESERILGRWLEHQERDAYVVATKVRWTTGTGPNDEGLGRKHILANLDRSLRNLRTDYVDLYQVHGWDSATRIDQLVRTLDDLVTSGKVRYLGVSNWAGWQIQKALDLADARDRERFVCLQPLYNLLDREAEHELIPLVRDAGMGLIPWSPLRGGWLSGKYRRGMARPEPGTRVDQAERAGWSEAWRLYDNERTWRVIDTLHEVAKESGHTPAQVALNWLAGRPGVTAPIIGARSVEQLADNLGAVGWRLDPEHVERLTAVSDREPPYPYALLAPRT